MPILISLSALVSMLIAFLFGTNLGNNAFFSYYFLLASIIIANLGYVTLGFIAICAIFLLRLRRIHKYPTRDTIRVSIFQVSASLFIGTFIGFVTLLLIAFVELNGFAFFLNVNPSLLGLTTDTNKIFFTLKKNATAPQIVSTDVYSVATAVAQATSGTSNLYGNTMLSAIPNFFILPVRRFSGSFIYLDNTLIITQLLPHDLQILSPELGYLFVGEYFPDRHIASFPHIAVLNQQQFISSGQIDQKTKLTTVITDIQKMEDGIASVSGSIQNDTAAIATNQDLTTTSLKQRDTAYDACLSQGSYTNGTFVPEFSKSHCQTILDTWDTTLTKQAKDAATLSAKLQSDQQVLKQYQYYDTFFKTQKSLMTITNASLSDELGVFLPPNNMKIIVDSKSTKQIAEYVETLCHEYLHYASFVEGKRFDSSFFEEGMTEYFARLVLQENMHERINIAYPAQVALITAFSKRIAQPDMENLYFTKDEVGLENTLDLAYGDNFYKNNFVYFESLQYTSDPQQATEITNTILKHMGEKSLSEKDIFGDGM